MQRYRGYEIIPTKLTQLHLQLQSTFRTMAGANTTRSPFLRLPPLAPSPRRIHSPAPNPSRIGFRRVSARSGHGDSDSDPLLRAALTAAWIRDQESRRSDPLFIDTYACGLLSSGECSDDDVRHCLDSENVLDWNHYRLATKFIDERLHQLLSSSDQFRQIVLLSDGMDTRPYRLNWPRLSAIYDISPKRVYELGTKRLKVIGAKTSRNCLLYHFPIDSRNLKEILCTNGFNGNRPSLWVLQGLPVPNSNSFEELLFLVSSLAMKGSIFFGELYIPSDWVTTGTKEEWLEKVILRNGFRLSMVKYSEVSENSGSDSDAGLTPGSILFVAEQLHMSDAQMEIWRMHLQRMENEADEDGFEEL